jgi:hypothetical protein
MKKGEQNLISIVIVTLILGLLILLFYYLFMYQKAYVPKWLEDILPSFLKSNSTISPTYNCPNIIGEIKNKYIYFNGQVTNLYFKVANVGMIKGYIYLDDGNIFSSDPQIGYLTWNKQTNRDEIYIDEDYLDAASKKYTKYQGQFPSVQYLKLLKGSYKYKDMTAFCRTDEEMDVINTGKECMNISCAILEGVCSGNPIAGKITDGKLDCKEKEYCYVDYSYNSPGNEEMNIGYFVSVNLYNKKDRIDFLALEQAKFIAGDLRNIGFNISSKNSYCYMVGSNKRILDYGFIIKGSRIMVPSLIWTPSDESFVEFVAWDRKTNQKVLKRVKVNINALPDGYPNGKIISDYNFKTELDKAKYGDTLYVMGLHYDWFQDNVVRDRRLYYLNYKINKVSKSQLDIYVEYVEYSTPGNPVWQKLKCNIISVDDSLGRESLTGSERSYSYSVEDSLTMTLNKKCSWA